MTCRKCSKSIPDESTFCLSCGAKQETMRSRRLRGNGSGTVYQLPNGKWRAEVNNNSADGTGRRTKSGFPRKKDAMEYLDTLKGERQKVSVTVKYLIDKYQDSEQYKKLVSKRKGYNTAIKKLEPVHTRHIADIRLEELQELLDSVEGYYPRKDIKQVLSHLYRIAEINGDVVRNFARYLVLPPLVEKEIEPFNEEEVLTFWEDYETGNTFTGYILLMVYAGMGPGELLKTQKYMINWDEQTIVGAGVKYRNKKELPIIIADDLIPVVKDLCEYSRGSSKLLDMPDSDFRKAFDSAIARMGVRSLKPYSCRHTCATALTMAGVEPPIIQMIMRHAKYQTTLRYTHIKVKPLLAAVNRL